MVKVEQAKMVSKSFHSMTLSVMKLKLKWTAARGKVRINVSFEFNHSDSIAADFNSRGTIIR